MTVLVTGSAGHLGEALMRNFRAARGRTLFPSLDHVYVNERAQTDLGWRPKHDFRHVLGCLATGEDFRSDLARGVGSKGYGSPPP